MKIKGRVLSTVFLVLVCGMYAVAETTIWDGSIGDWSNDAKWDNGVPQANDDVIVNAGTVTVSSATAELTSYTHNGGILIFTNWTTKLQATTVTLNGGEVTHVVCDISAETDNTNRVWIVCSNLTVEADGSVNVDNSGYLGGFDGTTLSGQGPGGGGNGSQGGGGGGYGGAGGKGWLGGAAGPTYGVTNAPVQPGSGGGASTVARGGDAGNGGGAVRIEADGTVMINGTVTACGGRGTNVPDRRGAGGSGGAVYITCHRFAGTGGLVAVDGGTSFNVGGGGGAGRIAISYDETAQQSGQKPRVRFSCAQGLVGNQNSAAVNGDIGTFYAPSDAVLDGTWLPHTAQLALPSFASEWTQNSLLITNGWIRFLDADFDLVVKNDLTILGADGMIEMPVGGQIHCGGDLIVTNSGRLHVYSAPTNGTVADYGALVVVTGTLYIADSSWVYPHSDEEYGGSPKFSVGALAISEGGGVDAVGTGYRGGYNSDGYGPGKGLKGTAGREGSGGGYGGAGGASATIAGGAAYGRVNAPNEPGSGGGSRASGYGGAGGGLIRIEVAGDSVVDGILRADGGVGSYGGGSGGGIWVLSRGAFSGGASGLLSAAGSDGVISVSYDCGSGGGGRIAIWENVPESEDALILAGDLDKVQISTSHPNFLGVAEAPGATNGYVGGPGMDGSVVFLVLPPPTGTVIIVN